MRKQRERKRESVQRRVRGQSGCFSRARLQDGKNRLERREIRKQRKPQVGYGAAKRAPVHGSLAPEQPPGCQTRY